ncbi:MAG: glycosyl transferase [Bacteroidetes bacterium]|nr:MAG: glycosyl transferase [Bacteroidota bacterium]
MHILLVYNGRIPTPKYGGTSRVVWHLGKELKTMGHRLSFLVGKGSSCPFASILTLDPKRPLEAQIPDDVDLVHVHIPLKEALSKPHLCTIHGNTRSKAEIDINATFVSKNHASRHGSEVYVYNGLGLEEYGKPDFGRPRNYVHFLGKAAWSVKNLKGAMDLARTTKQQLRVLGGYRFNLKMGIRFTPDPRIRFEGMVGGERKNKLINGSRALLFPVLWHEPMGLAIVESLYFGCPVFGTPYGALPELVGPEFGFLSNRLSELAEAMQETGSYDRKRCHEYVCDHFASIHMTRNYLRLYEKVLNGENLNPRPPTPPNPQKDETGKILPWYKD